jgi:thymidylate synthase
MTAEALWIVAGRRDLAFLTQYNKKMAEYSDDGFTLYGAYGPRYVAQRDYVVNKLLEDRDTRQATLTLWRPNPHASKDIPCTVAVDFKIRRDVLNCHIFMRSSDIYLGLPYDMFSFSMIALDILHRFNAGSPTAPASPGLLYITAASSHIYERDVEKMNHVIAHPDGFIPKRTPTSLYALDGLGPERILEDILNESRVPWWNA